MLDRRGVVEVLDQRRCRRQRAPRRGVRPASPCSRGAQLQLVDHDLPSSRPTTYAHGLTRSPGSSSNGRSRVHAPPMRSLRSRTSTDCPALREVRGRGQPVVAAADDDRVPARVPPARRGAPASRPRPVPLRRPCPLRPSASLCHGPGRDGSLASPAVIASRAEGHEAGDHPVGDRVGGGVGQPAPARAAEHLAAGPREVHQRERQPLRGRRRARWCPRAAPSRASSRSPAPARRARSRRPAARPPRAGEGRAHIGAAATRPIRIGQIRPRRSDSRPNAGLAAPSTRADTRNTAPTASPLAPSSSRRSGVRTQIAPEKTAGSITSQNPAATGPARHRPAQARPARERGRPRRRRQVGPDGQAGPEHGRRREDGLGPDDRRDGADHRTHQDAEDRRGQGRADHLPATLGRRLARRARRARRSMRTPRRRPEGSARRPAERCPSRRRTTKPEPPPSGASPPGRSGARRPAPRAQRPGTSRSGSPPRRRR